MAGMSRPRAPRIWLFLALLLALGPLQARVAFACAMMDAVVIGDCCCDDAGDPGCDAVDCGQDTMSGSGPCCERSVSLQVEAPAEPEAAALAFAEFRSGLDPPPAAPPPTLSLSALPAACGAISRQVPHRGTHPGSDLYLTTLRLRI